MLQSNIDNSFILEFNLILEFDFIVYYYYYYFVFDFGSDRIGSDRFGSVRFGSVRFGPNRIVSDRFGPNRNNQREFQFKELLPLDCLPPTVVSFTFSTYLWW
jgi:hypothetical protein